jgi:predicted RNA polymerase sigma factor
VTTPGAPDIEGLLRQLGPQVLGALARRHGQFESCEDATQEALLAAAKQWRKQGSRTTRGDG